MVTRTLLMYDEAGNKLYLEGKKLAVRNRQGRLVNPKDSKKFIQAYRSRGGFKRAGKIRFSSKQKKQYVTLYPKTKRRGK